MKFQYAAPPRCPKCLNLHYTDMSCRDSAVTKHMHRELTRQINNLRRNRMQHIEDVFMSAICAVCGDMPTYEHINAMAKVFISPYGAYTLTWGSPDNVIACVPPPSYHYHPYGKENTH